jgi:general secretion pathway protein A
MYQEFFGLQKLPFNLTPDPEFLFLPSKHREALAGLTYAVLERKGFVVLTGDAGTGKTTLLSSVLSHLPAERIQSSVILNPTLTPSEFLEIVLLDFGIPNVPVSKAQRLWMLQEFLLKVYREDQIAILVIDEAHKLSLEVLEEVRLLGNFEYAADKFLQIVLLGQSELDDLLNRYDLRQFKQRIALRLYIDPLASSDVGRYIGFRWTKAGAKEPPPFTPEAVDGVIQWSRRIPRLINAICDTALLMAYADGCHRVGLNYVQDAAANLALVAAPILPHLAAVPLSRESDLSLKLAPVEMAAPPKTLPDSPQEDPDDAPKPAPHGTPRENPSLLRRLAGKFGLPR